VPAIERAFTEPVPAEIYVDTDLLIAFVTRSDPHYQRARTLFRRLAETGTVLYLSSLSWIEFAHVVSRERFRQRLTAAERRQYGLDRWESSETRQAYLGALSGAVQGMLDYFRWEEIPLNTDVRVLALDYMARYALGRHDAAHLASATYAQVSDLASFDEAFRRVDGLALWNDGIYAA